MPAPTGSADPPSVAELLLLGPLGRRVLVLVLLAGVVAAVVLGAAIVSLQTHLADEQAQGRSVNALGMLLANGSSAVTAWPGWVAAACFLAAAARTRPDDDAPPDGHVPGKGAWSVTELRRSLGREYRAARVALCAIAFVAAVDLCRAAGLVAVAARRAGGGNAEWVATVIEAAGLVAAALTLGLWCRRHGTRLRRWGAR